MDAAAFAEMDKVGQTLLNIIQGWANIIENYYWTSLKLGQTLLIGTKKLEGFDRPVLGNLKKLTTQFVQTFKKTGSSEAADITDHSTTRDGADKSQREHKTVSSQTCICIYVIN